MNDRDRCRLGDQLGDLLAQVEKLPCHRPQDRLRAVHQLVRQRHCVEIGNRRRVQDQRPAERKRRRQAVASEALSHDVN
jgi:hypothetical protein